jgi:DNA-binding GntR family transcriptional regulator
MEQASVPSLVHESLGDRVYRTLRELILGQLFSPGSKVRIPQLCRELGVSRTPVVEALRRLAAEGLLESIPRHGVFVLNYRTERIRDIFAVREALEGAAARSAALEATADDLARLAAGLARLEEAERAVDVEKYTRSTLDFHNQVVAAARNEVLARYLENVYSQILVLRLQRLYTLHDTPRLARSLNDHREIYEAIAAHDADRAEAVARRHIRLLLDDLLSAARS